MAIYVNGDTKVLVQGMTGSTGLKHTKLMIASGTKVVGGITPGKRGQVVEGVPIFNTVQEAKDATGADATIIFVPPAFTADAIMEAVDAEMRFCVCITENMPVQDMVKVKYHMRGKKTLLLGPNCSGIITPGGCKMGIMPTEIHKPGHVGVVSRSGSLTYETTKQLTASGFGQTTVVGIGGDPIRGISFLDVLREFESDPETRAVVMIGEIGGRVEEEAAVWIQKNMTKPVVAFIGGRTAPPGKRMGHAGAVVSGAGGSAESKVKFLNEHGIPVADTSDMIGETLVKLLRERGVYDQCKG